MKRVLYKLAAVLILVATVSIAWLWMEMNEFLTSPMQIPEGGIAVEVKQGSNLTRIANDLAKNKIIDKPRYLLFYARWCAEANKVHTGEYRLERGITPEKFLAMLVAGKVAQYSITIVEGWNFKQLMQTVNEDPSLSHELAGLDDESIMTKLGYKGQHPEGRFMPDTYAFPRGMSDIAFLNRAYQAMQTYIDARWPERDIGIPVKNKDEALILASIVEKETGLKSERRAIAGVFSRRLLKRMRLQTDPTVIYGMGEKYKGNIRRQDLQQDNPYNTYRRFGLPPSPIAMPGRDAIDAVLHPAEGTELYFVAKGDGSHHFSSSLEEHNEAVIKYQLNGRRKPFSSFDPVKQDNR